MKFYAQFHTSQVRKIYQKQIISFSFFKRFVGFIPTKEMILPWVSTDSVLVLSVKAKDKENCETKQRQQNEEPIMSFMMSLETVSDATQFRESEFTNHKDKEVFSKSTSH